MNQFPRDPMHAHTRFIAAFCEDLADMCLNGGNGTPRADAVCALDRELRNQGSTGNPVDLSIQGGRGLTPRR